MEELNKVREAVEYLRSRGISEVKTAIILGTGLGKLTDEMEIAHSVDYDDIPHFPVSTVEFHHGKLIYGRLGAETLIAFKGRFHYYEGYSARELVFPVRVAHELGVERLLLSNAAGAMNPAFQKGDLMLISDHINLLPDNPLRGQNEDHWGPRFPDMSEAYDSVLRKKFRQLASNLNIYLREGVYVAVAGPNLETAAEYRFLRTIGADAVGMSTVPEVLAARHMGMACCAISVLTDECDPDDLQAVDISDIIAVAERAEIDLIKLFKGLIQ
jgi:purine-nucleoside phosphorylase